MPNEVSQELTDWASAHQEQLGDMRLNEWLEDTNPYYGAKNRHDYEATMIQKIMDQQYNSAEAAKNRDWQEYMSNTQYSRAMADLKSAGVNPYYLFSQGGSAASASGGSAAASSGTSIPSGSKAGSTALAAGIAIAKLIAMIASA